MDNQVTQLNGLLEALRAISGKEPAPGDVQRLMALARVLGMRGDDGMLPILAVLDTYHGIFSRLPAEMQASAKAVADGAVEQAKARIWCRLWKTRLPEPRKMPSAGSTRPGHCGPWQ